MIFRLYALLKVHLVEEELYVGIVNKGVTADVADVLAAGLDHPDLRRGLSARSADPSGVRRRALSSEA